MFPSNRPICVKWLQKALCMRFFFVVFRYFSKNFPSGAPVHVVLLSVNVISFQLRFAMAGPSYFVLLAGC